MDTDLKWKKVDWSQSPYPEREYQYLTYEYLADKDDNWIATIEQFTSNEKCFYANTANERSGCIPSYELAKQWCEHKAGMMN